MTFQLSYFSHTIMICVYVEIKKGEHFCSPFVRMTGLEPTRRKTLDPKSSAATNYATSAFAIAKVVLYWAFSKCFPDFF